MINTDYEQWYLQNLTNTQTVQNKKSQQTPAATTREKQDVSTRNYDTVDFTDDARAMLQERMVEKAQETAQSYSYSSTAAEQEDSATRTDAYQPESSRQANAAEFITSATPQQNDSTQSEQDDFHIGLLDLIDSGSIEIKAPEKKEEQPQQEIKPVERSVNSDVNETSEVTAPATAGIQAPEAPQNVSVTENVSVNPAEYSEKTEMSAPASREKLDKVEEIEQSPTQATSAELEETQTSAKVTPAQQKGIQAYQRIQSYTNPYTMSMNAAYSVA